MATADGVGVGSAEAGFVRKASGLVRAWSPVDAWIYNVFAINVVAQVALSYVLIPVLYPTASPWLAAVIAGGFCLFEAVVYAFLVTVMPRSGGDYVFQSRILGGAWATVFAFTLIALSAAIFMALAGWLGAVLIFSPFFTMLGGQYDQQWLLDLGGWFAGKHAIFIMGVVCTLWGAFITIVGMRIYALVQRWFFAVGCVCLAVFVVALLASDQQSFVNNFDSFMATNFAVDNAYETVLANSPPPDTSFAIGATFLAAVVAAFSLIYPGWSAQTGGEIRRAGTVRANMYAIVGAEIFSLAVMATIAALLVSRVGMDFLVSSGTLYFEGAENNPLPVPPFLGFLLALVVNSSVFTWIAFVMFMAWFFMWFPNIPLAGSRVLLAMSFDRVLPEWLGRVNPRTHTPVNAIVIYSIPMIALAAMYAYIANFYQLTLGLSVQGATAIAVTMVAAAILPWVEREMYASSPIARFRVGPVPAITVAAVVFLGFAVYLDVQFLKSDKLGINGTRGLVFVASVYALALVVYVVAKLYRKHREGMDLAVVYRELPVE
jgi:APA family basic amino acid/polyamine antiporter